MTTIHQEALAKLSNSWKPLNTLKAYKSAGSVAFDDLVAYGKADVLRTPVIKNGICYGEHIYFRLSAKGGN